MLSVSAEGKAYKKRPHRKVKSGCHTCKRRKIKCDELKPKCSNCHRYASTCVYPDSAENEHRMFSASPPPHSPENYGEGGPRINHELPMRDLALMHQWSISTCYGYGDLFPEDVDPWRDEMPILGQQFPFLMRGMLALSALHLAKNSADRNVRIRYLRTAAYHQDLAIPEYRSALVDVTKESALAIMAFSSILTVYSFAAPKNFETRFSDEMAEWIFLHRGASEIPPHWQAWIAGSFLDCQKRRRNLQPVDPSMNPEDGQLQFLKTLIAALPPEDMSDASACEAALYWLRQAVAHTYNQESMIGAKYAVAFWIEHVPQSFLDLIGLKKPHAMVFLANLAVLIKRASHFWFVEGFAEHVIRGVKLLIGSELLPYIDYPMRVCGMI